MEGGRPKMAMGFEGKIQGPGGQRMSNTRKKIFDSQARSMAALQKDVDNIARLARRAGVKTVGEFLEFYDVDPELKARLAHAPELEISALKYIAGAIKLPKQAGAIKPRTAKKLVNFIEKKPPVSNSLQDQKGAAS